MNKISGLFLCLIGLLVFGWLAVPAMAADRVAVFDQGHGQRFMIEGNEPLGLSTLAGTFLKQGLTPRVHNGQITPESLREASALVISGPFLPIGESELAAINGFLVRGGRLCVMLHIANPVRPFLRSLGVAVTGTPIREQLNLVGDDPLEFRVTNLVAHPVTAGLPGFAVKGCWGLRNMNAVSHVLAWSSPRTWFDINGDGMQGPGEPSMPQGVLVGGDRGKGAFLVFGDDAIFQNRFLAGDNLKLARNLAVWLKGGGGK